MRETEAKILDIDREAVERRLHDLGAKEVSRGTLHALLFDTPERALKARGEHLRLRTGPQGAMLTHKGPKQVIDGAKACEETELRVDDSAKMRAILEALGLRVQLETVKERASYVLGDAHIEIDKYAGEHAFIPVFLEIEAPDADAIRACARALGYSPDRLVPHGFGNLVKHYAHKQGLHESAFSNTHE